MGTVANHIAAFSIVHDYVFTGKKLRNITFDVYIRWFLTYFLSYSSLLQDSSLIVIDLNSLNSINISVRL